MDGGHLGREHRFHLITGFDATNNRKHEIDTRNVELPVLVADVEQALSLAIAVPAAAITG